MNTTTIKEGLKGLEELHVSDIEELTEQQAKQIKLKHKVIKDFDIYFIDFKGYYGFSYIAFKNGKRVKHLNDYELHHKRLNGNIDKLLEYYINSIKNKVFTYEELNSINDYNDFNNKRMFIINNLVYCYDYESIFGFGGRKTNYQYHSKQALGWFKNEEDAKLINKIYDNLYMLHFDKLLNDSDYFKKAAYYELANHEAGYTGDFTDGLRALGLTYSRISDKYKIIVNDVLKDLIKNSYN